MCQRCADFLPDVLVYIIVCIFATSLPGRLWFNVCHNLKSGLSFIFECPANGCAQELPFVLHNIELLSARFSAVHVVLVENDSKDPTAEIFSNWARGFAKEISPGEERFYPAGGSQSLLSAELIRFKVEVNFNCSRLEKQNAIADSLCQRMEKWAAKKRRKKNLETLAVARNLYLEVCIRMLRHL